MVVRESFDLELTNLKNKLLELGRLAEAALSKAMEALKNKDIELALQVMDEDVHADQLEEEINDQAIIMIARQSPVAKDLRRIIVAIKISADVERMADYAVNIAKETIRIGSQPHQLSYHGLITMAETAQNMLSLALTAYVEEDLALAKQLAEMDDSVDSMYGQIIKGYLEKTSEHKELITTTTQLCFVARYLERIADHTTNISEGIFYLVKGIRYDLND